MLLVLGILLAGGLVLRQILRPSDYGDIGPYRAGSLREIMSLEPVHQGQAVCARCHAEIAETHDKDIHFGVECEDCHGPGREHVAAHEAGTAADAPGVRMPKEYTLEGCLYCHRKLSARPRDFPQIDPEAHFAFLGVTRPETRCVECHSPHEPVFLLSRVRDARIHPIIHECVECHDEPPAGDHRDVEGHPALFTCRDCHAEVVADFEGRKHSFMRCTSCHFFHRENPTAGRILKNGNRRFCLLCHERKPFKDPDRMPQIDSEAHIGEMAEILEVPAESLRANRKACLECHRKLVHGKR